MTHPERETGGLCELRAFAEAATAGPWRRDENNVWGACNPDDTTSYGMGVNIVECRSSAPQWAREPLDYEKSESNAAFIAAANPAAVIALLNERDEASSTIRAQAAELERLRGALIDACDAADALLVRITAEIGRYVIEATDEDMVPLMHETGVVLTGKMIRRLYEATDRDRALSPNTSEQST